MDLVKNMKKISKLLTDLEVAAKDLSWKGASHPSLHEGLEKDYVKARKAVEKAIKARIKSKVKIKLKIK